jgi:cell cycle checkpoint protein
MVDLVGPCAEGDGQYALVARLDNVKLFSQLLKSIHFRDMSTWSVSANGIKVTVEDAKSVQTNAYIKGDIFDEFSLKPGRGDELGTDDLSFSVKLGTVLECLNMFGGVGAGGEGGAPGSPNLKICYAGYGHPFILLLEEAGVVTDCKIKTREAEECLDFNFANAHIVSKIIMNSDHLKDVLNELDSSSEHIQFCVSPSDQTLELATRGPAGDCEVTVPRSSDMVEHFTCSATSKARYKLAMMKHGIRPLGLAEKVSIRMDEREFLCLQYMVDTGNGPAFLEFYCAPEEEEPDR